VQVSAAGFTAGGVDLLSKSLKISFTEPEVSIRTTLRAAPTVAFAGRAILSRGTLQPVRKIRMEGDKGLESVQGNIQPNGTFIGQGPLPLQS